MEDIGLSDLAVLLPATDIHTVDSSPGKVLGATFVEISGYDHNRKKVLSKQRIYCMERGGQHLPL